MNMRNIIAVLVIGFTFQLVGITNLKADEVDDGVYDAIVTTDSGSYTVPVEVEDGQVSEVHWPNGGDMTVDGADLEGGEAIGTNSRGDEVQIEIEDSQISNPDDSEDNNYGSDDNND